PIVPAQRIEIAALVKVVDDVPRTLLLVAFEEGHEIVAIKMNLEGLLACVEARLHFLLDVRDASCGAERREPRDQRNGGVALCAGFHYAGPTHHHRDAHATFPGGTFLTMEGRHSAVRPKCNLRAIVGGVENDRVVGDTQIVELLEELTDHAVVLDHAVGVNPLAGLAKRLWLEMGEDVHAG